MLGRRVWISIFIASMLVLGACAGDGEDGSEDTPEVAVTGDFTTGDLESLTLAADDVQGLEFAAERSGPETLRQYARGDIAVIGRLGEAGFVLGWASTFDAPTTNDIPTPNDMGVAVLSSKASIHENADGAGEAIRNPQALPYTTDFRSKPVDGLGEEAVRTDYQQTAVWGSAETVAFTWRQSNARMTLMAIGGPPESTPIDDGALLEMAKELAEGAEPTDAPPVEVPQAEDGEVAFEDDFSNPQSGWVPKKFDDPDSASGSEAFAENRDGAWLMYLERSWFFSSTDEFDPELATLGDARVEFTAYPGENMQHSNYGGVCRADTKRVRAYAAYVGSSSSLGVFRITEGERAPLVTSGDGAIGVLKYEGGDRFRMECVGDEIVRIALYVNDELVIDVLDDDPLPPGGGGMYLESPGEDVTAEVYFDDFSLSET